MNSLASLDPRRSLGAAVGWLILAVSVGLAIIAGLWAGTTVRDTLISQQRQRLEAAADHIATELSLGIGLRQQALEAAAAILAPQLARRRIESVEPVLEDVRQGFPEMTSIEVFDRDGQMLARADATSATPATPNLEGRFVALTTQINTAAGVEVGALVARLDWSWADALARNLHPELDDSAGEAWMLVDQAGIVRIGPPNWLGRAEPTGKDLMRTRARPATSPALTRMGWRVQVIQPADQAEKGAHVMEWRIFATILAFGLVGAAGGLIIARRLTRRIAVIADSAERLLTGGDDGHIAIPHGSDEATRLGVALDGLFGNLTRERRELATLNAELDRRVASRTREIERLAGEARYAAQVRERLKLARDLHDTLAHSMMAMLTEIRLLKRLAKSNPDALAEELEQAEDAARHGLDEARAAITQMRFNAARDVGLGAALGEFLKRFGERTGITVDFHCAPVAGRFAETRAEVLFRIAEEALRNIERHARADRTEVNLRDTLDADGLELNIHDNGHGFDVGAEHPGHYGLVGMQEQAGLIGARLEIRSAPGHGTEVRISLRTAPDLGDE